MSLPKYADITYRTIYSIQIVVNIIGNSLVCLVVRCFPFMKTSMNYLLLHLAICDIMAGVFFSAHRILYGLYDHPSGHFGNILCKFLSYGNLAWHASCASVCTLIAIAWERYNAIVKPYAPRFSIKRVKIMVIVSWVYACAICLLDTIALEYNPKIKSCDLIWRQEWALKADATIWMFAFGIFPYCIMMTFYGRVVQTLWCSGNRNGGISHSNLYKSRKKVTKITMIVTGIFFACWMPNTINYFITSFSARDSSTKEKMESASPYLYPTALVLVLLNSTINPFIYALQDVRFRRCMSRLLCRRWNKRRENKVYVINMPLKKLKSVH